MSSSKTSRRNDENRGSRKRYASPCKCGSTCALVPRQNAEQPTVLFEYLRTLSDESRDKALSTMSELVRTVNVPERRTRRSDDCGRTRHGSRVRVINACTQTSDVSRGRPRDGDPRTDREARARSSASTNVRRTAAAEKKPRGPPAVVEGSRTAGRHGPTTTTMCNCCHETANEIATSDLRRGPAVDSGSSPSYPAQTDRAADQCPKGFGRRRYDDLTTSTSKSPVRSVRDQSRARGPIAVSTPKKFAGDHMSFFAAAASKNRPEKTVSRDDRSAAVRRSVDNRGRLQTTAASRDDDRSVRSRRGGWSSSMEASTMANNNRWTFATPARQCNHDVSMANWWPVISAEYDPEMSPVQSDERRTAGKGIKKSESDQLFEFLRPNN